MAYSELVIIENRILNNLAEMEELALEYKNLVSNLLALNEAVEATRAGEHGKGFAV